MMTRGFSPQDLAGAQNLLAALFDEVQAQESTLAGGVKLGIGGSAIQALRESRITFGNPVDNLIRLTPAWFTAVGVPLQEIWQQQMEEQFDFYYLTLTVSLLPKAGAQFGQLSCHLEFELEEGGDVIVQRLFPISKWREMLSASGELNLALDGQLRWSAGTDGLLVVNQANVPISVQASVANTNTLKAAITFPHYTFKLGKAEIVATGEGNSFCDWRLKNPELHETQTATFIVVFKVPQGTETVRLTGLVVAEPSWRWLTTSVRGIFAFLSQPLQALLRRQEEERSPQERLPIGDHEQWTLTLPPSSR